MLFFYDTMFTVIVAHRNPHSETCSVRDRTDNSAKIIANVPTNRNLNLCYADMTDCNI